MQNNGIDHGVADRGTEATNHQTENLTAATQRVAIEYLPADISSYIGTCLADERRKARLTQLELSALTGVDQAVISRVEHGKGNPTVSLLQSLALPLNLHVALVPNDTSAD